MDLKCLNAFDFEISTRCNMKCKYCYLGAMSDVPRVDMCDEVVETSLSLVEKIVAAKGGQPFTLHFYGGEPFAAFERMKSIVVRARDRKINCRYGIVTNGCTATPEQVRWCVQNGLTAQRSIDGCAEAMEFNRPGVIRKYEAETLLWKDFALPRRCTVCPEAAPLILEIAALLHRAGVRQRGGVHSGRISRLDARAVGRVAQEPQGAGRGVRRRVQTGKALLDAPFSTRGRGAFRASDQRRRVRRRPLPAGHHSRRADRPLPPLLPRAGRKSDVPGHGRGAARRHGPRLRPGVDLADGIHRRAKGAAAVRELRRAGQL